MPLPERTRCQVIDVAGLGDLPASVVLADTPAVGQVLGEALDVWPAAGRFVLSGPSAASVERDMNKIAACYAVTVKTGE
jgi:hypothetical protein